MLYIKQETIHPSLFLCESPHTTTTGQTMVTVVIWTLVFSVPTDNQDGHWDHNRTGPESDQQSLDKTLFPSSELFCSFMLPSYPLKKYHSPGKTPTIG